MVQHRRHSMALALSFAVKSLATWFPHLFRHHTPASKYNHVLTNILVMIKSFLVHSFSFILSFKFGIVQNKNPSLFLFLYKYIGTNFRLRFHPIFLQYMYTTLSSYILQCTFCTDI